MDSNLEQAREWFFKGIEHFEKDQWEMALSAFETALAFAPGRPSVLGNYGIALFRLGRVDEALPPLRQATAADPGHVEAWACLGLACERLGQWEEAAEALGRGADLSLKNAELPFRQGECLLRLGRALEAMAAYDRALAIDAEHAEAWTARGNLLRDMHQLDAAAQCFERALASGADPELVGYYLASVKGGGTPPMPPRQYVEGLFDDYASEFERHVVDQLRYQGHEMLIRPLAADGRRFGRALDLGCGTGLCGPLLRPFVEVLDGLDISQDMLTQAARHGAYRELIHADIRAYLDGATETADLVVAADVFIYVGELSGIFPAVRRLLTPGGRFVFTVEAPDKDDGMQLLPSLRYAHSERYIRDLAAASGFVVEDVVRAPIRYDQGRAVEGMYFYLA